jgi:hypothetical protein
MCEHLLNEVLFNTTRYTMREHPLNEELYTEVYTLWNILLFFPYKEGKCGLSCPLY